MIDVFRRYVDALAGITELSRDKAEKIVQELHQRGEIRVKDIQRTAQDLMDRSSRNRQELVRLVRKEIRSQVQALDLVRRDEVDRLVKRVRPGGAGGGQAGAIKPIPDAGAEKPAAKKTAAKPAPKKPTAKGGAKKPAAKTTAGKTTPKAKSTSKKSPKKSTGKGN